MNYHYVITLSIDLGNAVAPVGELLKRLNADIANAGMSEQLRCRSKCLTVTLTSPRELTKEDREKVKSTLLTTFNEREPAWKVQVESFRRKSGNVQQSAS